MKISNTIGRAEIDDNVCVVLMLFFRHHHPRGLPLSKILS